MVVLTGNNQSPLCFFKQDFFLLPLKKKPEKPQNEENLFSLKKSFLDDFFFYQRIIFFKACFICFYFCTFYGDLIKLADFPVP